MEGENTKKEGIKNEDESGACNRRTIGKRRRQVYTSYPAGANDKIATVTKISQERNENRFSRRATQAARGPCAGRIVGLGVGGAFTLSAVQNFLAFTLRAVQKFI